MTAIASTTGAKQDRADRILVNDDCRGCRIALYDSMSTLNLRPEYGWMSGSDDQIVGGMYQISDLTNLFEELCDSLCTVPGHPEIYVTGDVMSLNKLPGVAEVAIQ